MSMSLQQTRTCQQNQSRNTNIQSPTEEDKNYKRQHTTTLYQLNKRSTAKQQQQNHTNS